MIHYTDSAGCTFVYTHIHVTTINGKRNHEFEKNTTKQGEVCRWEGWMEEREGERGVII